jgi:ribosomal protein S18 acetylase RimI-like enzyme
VKDLAANSSLRAIILSTSVDNLVALSAYEKAGFERRRRFDDPEYGECWLLARDVRPV